MSWNNVKSSVQNSIKQNGSGIITGNLLQGVLLTICNEAELGIGPQGKSAYQVWLDERNVGTVSDFFASLKGEKGDYASLRKTTAGIEWKPKSSPDSEYELLITLDELSFHFSDFTNEQIEQLQKPALDAAEEADKATRRLNDLSDHRDKIIDSYWWRWNEATDEWENTGEKARGDDGNVMFASFYRKDSKLYMKTPGGYEGPQFKLLKNKLYVILNA